MADHFRRDIGVIVEADHDRRLVADHRPDAPQQLALAVLELLGHHRAMQVEIDAFDRQRLRQARDQLAGDHFISARSNGAPRCRARPQQRIDFMIAVVAGHETRRRSPLLLELRQHRLIAQQIGPVRRRGEILVIRRIGHEAIGFMHEPGDGDARHDYSPVRKILASVLAQQASAAFDPVVDAGDAQRPPEGRLCAGNHRLAELVFQPVERAERGHVRAT